ncbi:MAG TPA: DEAD/DEAH box helicase [Iamia sp.]|nr:DEAD/DEAH box helicase [Iamia sp.]
MSALGIRVGRAFFGQFGGRLKSVQEQAMAPVLAGTDVLIRAGTGSGKTEAAAAPLTERYLDDLDAGETVVILYISPTRALANDLARRLEPVYENLGLDVGVRHGERKDLARASCPGVLITTPESLDVMTSVREPRLLGARAIVLDEIHLLANTQRGLQLGIALHRLELLVERRLQTVGLSATVADPLAVWHFFRPGTDPEVIDDADPPRTLIRRIRIDVTHAELAERLARLGGETEKVLVFVNSRRECDVLADAIRDGAGFGEAVFSHHSSLTKEARERVEHEFERSDRAVCVATSTLELGIDIGDVTLVVLYGAPADWQSFLQRCGRGNRRSQTVQALCVVPAPRPDDVLGLRHLVTFQALLQQIDSGALDWALPFDLYGAAAQQFVSAVDGAGGAFTGINHFLEITEPWPHLHADVVEEILEELVAGEVLKRHPVHRRYGAAEGLWELRSLLQIWSNMPLSSREIELVHGNATLGHVPATNLLRLQEGRVFAFSGRRWEVEGFVAGTIRVRSTTRRPDVELKFGRRGAPLDAALIEQIRVLLAAGDVGAEVYPSGRADGLRTRLASLRPLAQDDVLPSRASDRGHTYLTFGGTLLNQLVATWAGSDPRRCGDFTLVVDDPLDTSAIPDCASLAPGLAAIDLDETEMSEFQRRLPVSLRRLEMENEWLRRPVNEQILERLRRAEVIPLPSAALDLVLA